MPLALSVRLDSSLVGRAASHSGEEASHAAVIVSMETACSVQDRSARWMRVCTIHAHTLWRRPLTVETRILITVCVKVSAWQLRS
jgi:hypothetical protein